MFKVITGIRRCGKSSLMKLTTNELRTSGVPEGQIIEINFESMRFSDMTAKEFHAYVTEQAVPGKRMYLFFDEVQQISGWKMRSIPSGSFLTFTATPSPIPCCCES